MLVFNIGTISYLYSAPGNKLKKTFGTSETYYQGSVLKINGNPVVLNPDGRAVWNSSTSKWEYEYDVKDHLGNTRASFGITDKVKVLQTRDYYPFGLEFANWYINDPNATKFRYNGKELQDEGGLGWYDYGARFYDPMLGRWHVVDPLAEKYYSISPYAYVANNPIIYIDPDGREIWLYQYDEDGNRVAELQYTPGMEYDGGNTYFANSITTLNQMNSVEIGSMVISDLHGSDNVFGVSNQSAVIDGAHQFVENAEGGGILKMGENFALEGLAHEMFHGYQHEMGQGGASIFNEVEANLFGYSVASQYAFGQGLPFGSAAPMGNTNAVGQAFESSFNELIYSNSFPKESFVSAVQTFRGGSMKNNSGIYSNTSSYPLQRSNQKTSLIKRFYPLMR